MSRNNQRDFSMDTKMGILKRDNYTCRYCKRNLKPLMYLPIYKTEFNPITIDHVIPLSKGGKSNLKNMVTCCRACNQDKADTVPPNKTQSKIGKKTRGAVSEIGKTKKQKKKEKYPTYTPSKEDFMLLAVAQQSEKKNVLTRIFRFAKID